eukprot:10943902-Heterocapsa_arctica.AAC.1
MYRARQPVNEPANQPTNMSPYRCTRTSVHDKGALHNKHGHRTNAFETQAWPLKLRLCAKWSALCEESKGDSEDARGPFKNL